MAIFMPVVSFVIGKCESSNFVLFCRFQDHFGYLRSQNYVALWSLFYPKEAVGGLDKVQGRIIKIIIGCNRLFLSVWPV